MQKRASYRLRERKSSFVELFRTTPTHTVCPNFYVLAHANGCGFSPQCSYCYLKSSFWFLDRQQAFINVDRMFDEVRRWIARENLETYMLNAGNLSDSLCFEARRPVMAQLIEIFREEAKGRPHTLLLVTKGGLRECETLFDLAPCENAVVSFSVNSPQASRRHERGAAPSMERIEAARRLKKAGWRIRIRIDPMIFGFDYDGVIQATRKLKPERVTLGTLRVEGNLWRFMPKELLLELKKPSNKKALARYAIQKRLSLYRPAVQALRDICPVALCEEIPEVWDALELDKVAKPCNCCV